MGAKVAHPSSTPATSCRFCACTSPRAMRSARSAAPSSRRCDSETWSSKWTARPERPRSFSVGAARLPGRGRFPGRGSPLPGHCCFLGRSPPLSRQDALLRCGSSFSRERCLLTCRASWHFDLAVSELVRCRARTPDRGGVASLLPASARSWKAARLPMLAGESPFSGDEKARAPPFDAATRWRQSSGPHRHHVPGTRCIRQWARRPRLFVAQLSGPLRDDLGLLDVHLGHVASHRWRRGCRAALPACNAGDTLISVGGRSWSAPSFSARRFSFASRSAIRFASRLVFESEWTCPASGPRRAWTSSGTPTALCSAMVRELLRVLRPWVVVHSLYEFLMQWIEVPVGCQELRIRHRRRGRDPEVILAGLEAVLTAPRVYFCV